MGLIFLPFIALICVLSGLAYAWLIRRFILAWRSIPEWNPSEVFQPETFITVVVPARNEAGNLAKCLDSLLSQNYPQKLREIIVVDDFSTDKTAEIALTFAPNVQLIRLSEILSEERTVAFKKKAIELAIGKAKGDLILCTDADCLAHPDWFRYMASIYEIKKPKLIAGPVVFSSGNQFLSKFQSLDFLGLMGATAVGMASERFQFGNGANLAYEKNAFYAVDGFEGTDHLASGDDIFLIHKMAIRFPGQLLFLKSKNAIVTSSTEATIGDFIRQRIRWATKTGQYRDRTILMIWGMVWIFSVSLLAGLTISLLIDIRIFFFFLIVLTFKFVLDYKYLREQATFYRKEELLRLPFFLLASITELVYVTIAGLAGMLIRNYTWKGRKVR